MFIYLKPSCDSELSNLPDKEDSDKYTVVSVLMELRIRDWRGTSRKQFPLARLHGK